MVTGELPSRRSYASLTAIGSKLFLFGGFLKATASISNEMFVLDTGKTYKAPLWTKMRLILLQTSQNGSGMRSERQWMPPEAATSTQRLPWGPEYVFSEGVMLKDG